MLQRTKQTNYARLWTALQNIFSICGKFILILGTGTLNHRMVICKVCAAVARLRGIWRCCFASIYLDQWWDISHSGTNNTTVRVTFACSLSSWQQKRRSTKLQEAVCKLCHLTSEHRRSSIQIGTHIIAVAQRYSSHEHLFCALFPKSRHRFLVLCPGELWQNWLPPVKPASWIPSSRTVLLQSQCWLSQDLVDSGQLLRN